MKRSPAIVLALSVPAAFSTAGCPVYTDEEESACAAGYYYDYTWHACRPERHFGNRGGEGGAADDAGTSGEAGASGAGGEGGGAT